MREEIPTCRIAYGWNVTRIASEFMRSLRPSIGQNKTTPEIKKQIKEWDQRAVDGDLDMKVDINFGDKSCDQPLTKKDRNDVRRFLKSQYTQLKFNLER